MLKRVKIDNFKSFVNFEVELKPLQLLLGGNGSGKTTFLDALSCLRKLVIEGRPAFEVFPPYTATRWLDRDTQTIELDVDLAGHQFQYSLQILNDRKANRTTLIRESLLHDNAMVFDAQSQQGARFAGSATAIYFGQDQSVLGQAGRQQGSAAVHVFLDWLTHLYLVRANPARITGRADRGKPHPTDDLEDFSAWYMGVVLDRPRESLAFQEALRAFLPGFVSLYHRDSLQGFRILTALFSSGDPSAPPVAFSFDELSDGQRMLIALHALLHLAALRGRTVLFDEPDNFLALREIQPWLLAMCDHVEDTHAQVILASHHPEILNQLAVSNGLLLSRDATGPVRAEPYKPTTEGALTPAEEIARGWERE